MEPTEALPLAAMIGLDWSKEHHDIALQVTGSTTVEHHRFAHDPAVVADWLRTLHERFDGHPVGIALETSKGAIVHALMEATHVVLFPINPRSLHRFRETFSPNGAKDDAPDAGLLLRMLVHHRDRLTPLRPHDVETRRLQNLVHHRRDLVEMRTQLTLKLQAALGAYYPLALDVTGEDLYAPLACDFVQRWPTLEALQRARPATLRAFYTMHNCRQQTRIAERVQRIREAVPLTRDVAIIESHALLAQCFAQQLVTLAASIRTVEDRIAAVFAAHPDAALFASFPGAGAAFAPRLLAAFGSQRDRYKTAEDMQKAAGIAPVTIRSGRSCVVHWRWATSTFQRQTFHEFAQYSIRHVAWARAFYHLQRSRGHSHHATLRSLAFKWIRIIWRCWQDHTPYDDARYTRALTLRGSPLSQHLNPAPVRAA